MQTNPQAARPGQATEKAIQEDHAGKPASTGESPREARWRVERERREAEVKRHPHKGY